MLVDSHCHLDLIKNSNPDTLIAAAHAQGVSHFLNVSIALDHFPTLLSIAQRIDNVFASVGIHPNTSSDMTVDVKTLKTMANDPNVIAIGETGLDYFRSQGDLTWQHQRFRTHIQAAKEVGKPLIIHSRDAAQDTLRILREENAVAIGGVMHCFVEDWETAQQAMEMGFYISFSGIVTFKNAKALQAVAKQVPLDRMLVETDAPYLAPVPYRGKTNQPAYVKHVAQFIADLREETFEKIANVTTENFFRLFSSATT
ncbi:TatD family hydrolase [Candidatus Parabeggiatoa sp. HSG14]|uniref:TatD family hydrolase n=1 Tax=Candidatus Parabeggiatoa sp. HSG14 TaxID=3055593 RepID=UPI0025A722EF|nr:TatD family hydrolase [Thiotrichales bacterium HSG14]